MATKESDGQNLRDERSIKWQLATDLAEMDDRDAGFPRAAAKIKDVIHYTLTFDDPEYTDGVMRALNSFLGQGYQLVEVRNLWRRHHGGRGRLGVRAVLRQPAPKDQVFTVYLESEESNWAVAADTAIYEQLRGVTTARRRKVLQAESARIYGLVDVPPGAMDIREFP
ncbi:hypothetical protein [Crossiella cryophila]|uniref:Uncharacterized protein n=1 Tax=Crossiella cryophila TaxID=43355 RepID=A0A7W7CCK2_9PSEU|nr:hypothetical protein [Crossiella cryophila]MBB4677388.1 hypothetical protein [Crossiella cryophila]